MRFAEKLPLVVATVRHDVRAIWSATNIAVAGRGLNDVDHLAELSRLIGDREERERSMTAGTGGHRSTSTGRMAEGIPGICS
ncbi:TraM recognition domain-containing protein [Microlunatus sp. Gsoil 973]|uniref:TraM recognition domain-containing protein n=1 Tax=Microlunatus sp. Gsoil 973 TaxID=2672569 RepID=UPI00351B7C3B